MAKKYIRNLILPSTLIVGAFSLSSCSLFELELPSSNSTNVHPNLFFDGWKPSKNISNSYRVKPNKIRVFKHTLNGVNYVSLNEMVNKFKGFFDLRSVYSKIDSNDNTFELHTRNGLIIFDPIDEKVYFSSSAAFSFLKPQSNFNFTDYLKYTDSTAHSLKNKNEKISSFDLSKYDMELLLVDNELFLPLSLFNLMFASTSYYNFYYDGEQIVGADYEQSASRKNPILSSFYGKTKKVEKQSRINNFNHLAFLFDHYYGLAQRKYREKNAANFAEYTEKIGVKDKLLSTNPNEYLDGYDELVYKNLNELHSRINLYSYDAPTSLTEKHRGARGLSPKARDFASVHKLLEEQRSNISFDGRNYKDYLTHIETPDGKTARIIFDEFKSGTIDENNSNEAWRYDTYWLLDRAIKSLQQRDSGHKIKNIILDISLNGGGSTIALQKALGFLSNNKINLWTQDTLDKTYDEVKFKVDTNQDNRYNDDDGYGQYNWFVLTGINTFSAANLFAHIAKQDRLATIIGQKSGGGMFAVLPTVLPDGTNLDISGITAFSGKANKIVESQEDLPITEDGVDVDYKLDYHFFYSDKLYELIDEINKEKAKDEGPSFSY